MNDNININNIFSNVASGVKDVLKMYGGFAKETAKAGTSIAKGFGAASLSFGLSAAEALPRIISPKTRMTIIPPTPAPGLSFFGPIQSIQSRQQEQLQAGGSPGRAALSAFGYTLLEEPIGVALKPLLIGGSILWKTLGRKTITESIDTIAKSQDPAVIQNELGKILKTDPVKQAELTRKLVNTNDSSAVNKVIQDEINAIKETGQSWNDLTSSIKQAKSSGKTFNEWVKGQGTPVFRGGDTAIDTTRGASRGISVSTDKGIAETFTPPKGGVVDDAFISPTAKILKESNIPNELQSAYLTEAKQLADPNNFSTTLQKSVIEKQQAIIDYAKKNGFDGVEFPFENEIRIVNNKVLKTRSQLKAEWDGGGVSGIKESGLTKTVRENPAFSPELRQGASGVYKTITNKATIAEADTVIARNFDEAKNIALSEERTALSNTVSLKVVQRLQQEADLFKASNPEKATQLHEEALRIIDHVSSLSSKSGQTVQALVLWSKMTPEGVLYKTQKMIREANKKLSPSNQLKLSAEKAKDFYERMTAINKMADGDEKIVQTALLMRDMGGIIPPGILRKISTLQIFAQLLNPKTLIRNIVGNTSFGAFELASDVVGTVLESPLRLIPGYKPSKSLPHLGVYFRGGAKGFSQGLRDALKGIDTANLGTKFDIPQTPTFIGRDGKLNAVGAALEKTLNVVLKAPDRAAYQATVENSLYMQMKAARVTTPTEVMKEIAHADALYKTFQDENSTVYLFRTVKKALNLGKDFGVGDIVLKYPKTPANLLNRGLAYSPFGFYRTISELARPLFTGKPFNKKAFFESTARAITGTTTLFGIGATLHKMGIITTQQSTDKGVADIERGIGLGQYKLNVSALKRFYMGGGSDPELAKLQSRDTLITYDWLQPNAVSLAMGANFDEKKGDIKSILGSIMETVSAGTETLQEQPLVAGITNLFKYGDINTAVEQVITRLPSSFVPTLLNQIRQMNDNTQRNVYDSDPLKYSYNLAKNRIPGLASTLPPRVDVFGEDRELYQSRTNGFFNVMFNPSFVTKYKPTPEALLVLDLYKESGSSEGVPNVIKTKQFIRKAGEEKGSYIQLSPNQVAELQRFNGTIIKDLFTRLAANESFNNGPVDKRVSYIGSLLTSVGAAGKIVIIGDRPKKTPSKMTLEIIKNYVKPRE